jgi:multidrug efflux pump subunit AcrA (membrane-fusion protein)
VDLYAAPMTAHEGDFAVPIPGVQRRSWLWAVGALVLVALIIAAYRLWFSGGASAQPAETAAVTRTTIRSTIEASGSVESQESAALSFSMPGRVKEVAVKLGDSVETGQTLAVMESDDLDSAVLAAEANLQLARLKLTQLLNGASPAEIAVGQQAVSNAQAARDKVADDVRKLEEGASAADLDAAQAAVTKAEAALAESDDALARLSDGASQAEISAAEAAVRSASATLAAAERALADAETGTAAAEGALLSARATYCALLSARAEVCPSSTVPLPRATLDLLLGDSSGTSDATLAKDISDLLKANATYVTATESAASASDAVDVARSGLSASRKKLDKLRAGADDTQIQAAEAAVAAARDGVSAARSRLTDVQDGASPEERAVARSALTASDDSLAAAQAKLADVLDGPDPDDVALLKAQVHVAEIAVLRALADQAHARLLAPFSGVIAAVNVHPGEYDTPAAPAFVLLTPGALRLDLVIGENDRPYVSNGQQGTITFDAMPNQAYPFVIRSIGDSPKIEQGVATYTAEASLTLPAGAVRPVPGMSGVTEVLITEKADVLAIPARALRRIGREQVVDVMAGGVVEERPVQAGISDGQYVEVLSGLAEGDQVVLRAVTNAASQALPTRERVLPGGVR